MDNQIIEKMIQKAFAARENAYAPYSNYKVGACVVSEDGEFFAGCNVENAAFLAVLHAEANAIGHLIAAGKKRITALLVVGTGDQLCTPCGGCRQVIREFAGYDVPIYLCDFKTRKVVETVTLGDLLPKSFGPEFLQL